MKSFTDATTWIIFSILLITRFLDSLMAVNAKYFLVADEYKAIYSVAAYILLIVILLINRERIYEFNVDKRYLYAFVVAGLLFSIFYLSFPLNIVVITGLLFILVQLQRGQFNFAVENHQSYFFSLLLLSVAPFLIPIILAWLYSQFPRIDTANFGLVLQEVNLPGILYEEFLFRGAMWAVLKKMNTKKEVTLLASILVFWLAHFNYWAIGVNYSFWVIIPYISIFYGLMIYKGRSIFDTAACHFFINVLTAAFNMGN